MANVTIEYKDNVIAEMDDSGSKTLNTSGCYCEGDIVVKHAPNIRTYTITLVDSSTTWVLLTALDDDVLEHINDPTMTATLTNIDPYEYEQYSRRFLIASNIQMGLQGGKYPTYGCSGFQGSESTPNFQPIYYQPDNTNEKTPLGGVGAFRVTDGKYYATGMGRPFKVGTYLLTFTW